jgi:hypothetical protein
MRSHIHSQYSELLQIRDSLQTASDNAYEAYKNVKDEISSAYHEYDDFCYLKEQKDAAYQEMKEIQAKFNQCKNICHKAESWVKSFSQKSDELENLAGNKTQNAIGFLESVIRIVHAYASVDYQINESGNSSGQSQRKSSLLTHQNRVNNSVKSDFSKEISVSGSNILIQNSIRQNSRGKDIVTFSITESGKGCMVVSYDAETKIATLGDTKTPSANSLFPEKEKGILYEAEKALKSYGCKRMVHQASPDKESFFKSCGYSIDSKSNIGDMNFSKEL